MSLVPPPPPRLEHAGNVGGPSPHGTERDPDRGERTQREEEEGRRGAFAIAAAEKKHAL